MLRAPGYGLQSARAGRAEPSLARPGRFPRWHAACSFQGVEGKTEDDVGARDRNDQAQTEREREEQRRREQNPKPERGRRDREGSGDMEQERDDER